jgi:hypothetical protein
MTTQQNENPNKDSNGKLEPFVPVPRRIKSDFRNGKLQKNELLTYVWVRLDADIFGVTTANLGVIRDDLFRGKSKNYVNKLLLSLKSKEYVWYSTRTGRRGSFEVHFGDWKLSSGQIKKLDKFFDSEVRGNKSTNATNKSEVAPSSDAPTPNFKHEKEPVVTTPSVEKDPPQVRGFYNDTDKKREREKYDKSLVKPSWKKVGVRSFTPRNSDEFRCQQIADELGEEHINFILSILKKHGIGIIDEAFGIFREDDKRKYIRNPGAYFNGIVKELTRGNEDE